MPFQIANCNSFIVAVVDDILCLCVCVSHSASCIKYSDLP